MLYSDVKYKTLDASCQVAIRAMPSGRIGRRFVSASRPTARPSTGFIIENATYYPVGTLVELDLYFAASEQAYRARGLVSWAQEASQKGSSHRLGIVVFGVEKMDDASMEVFPENVHPPTSSSRPGTGAARRPRTSSAAARGASSAPGHSRKSQGFAAPARTPSTADAKAGDIGHAATQAQKAMEGIAPVLPTAREIAELYTNLMGEEIEVRLRTEAPLIADNFAATVDFRTPEEVLAGVLSVDIELANWLGSALAMIPSSAAQEDILADRINDEVRDNIQEIFNITTSLLNKPGIPHHKLGRLYLNKAELPGEVAKLAAQSPHRVDFELEVPGYGTGRLAYIAQERLPSIKPSAPPAAPEATAPTPAPGLSPASRPAAPLSKPPGASSLIKLPTAGEIADLFTNLIGEEVSVMEAPAPLATERYAAAGEFETDEQDLSAIIAMDIELAVWLGSGLAMIPKDAAKKNVESKTISGEIADNTREILNIASSLFNKENQPHHIFTNMFLPPKEIFSERAQAALVRDVDRVDYQVEVPGYGKGLMTVLAAGGGRKVKEPTQKGVPSSLPPPPAAAAAQPAAQPAANSAQPEEPTEDKGGLLVQLPGRKDVADLMANLVGEEVAVEELPTGSLPLDEMICLGVYVAEDTALSAVAAMDVQLANRLGAALAMIPDDAVDEQIAANAVEGEIRENIKEIFNIAASLVNRPSAPHQRFDKLLIPSEDPSSTAVDKLVREPDSRRDFKLTVPGYGEGRLAYFTRKIHLNLPGPQDEPEASPRPDDDPAEDLPGVEVPFPKPTELGDFFTNLIGEEVSVVAVDAASVDPEDFTVFGDFISDDGRLGAVCAVDIALTNWLGASLAMIPPGAVQPDVQAKKVSDEVRENVKEVLNISTSTLNRPDSPHLRFRDIALTSQGPLPGRIAKLTNAPGRFGLFEVEIPGYGKGRLCYFGF